MPELQGLRATLLVALALVGPLSGCPASGGVTGDGGKVIADAGIVEDDASAYCPPDSPIFHVGMEAVGDNNKITARIVEAKPAPPQRYFNDWTVDFVAANGQPIEDAQLSKVQTFMTAHLHGVLAKKIVKLPEAGRFEIQDVDMFMRGPWEIRFWVSSQSAGDSYVVFNHCLVY